MPQKASPQCGSTTESWSWSARLFHGSSRKLRPIALPETRFLTMAMNTLLETDWSQLSMEKARVKLLRVESIFVKDVPEHPENTDALTLAKLELLPELRLDGIHMSTVYVKSHLAPAMKKAWG
ncbi:unnamed protein product [Cladocopium goreaui]|uniref:Uncharacterized protein n=1 Tax=Cladocopium goreaui TaxID=2562237 RepID=A0A9P1GE60_9DINO|nr:unnamed protein product [Cladocopium goreaui]